MGEDPDLVITLQCPFTADLGVFEDFAEYNHLIQADAKGQTRDVFSNIFRVSPFHISKESVPGFTGFRCWLLFKLVFVRVVIIKLEVGASAPDGGYLELRVL